MYTGKKKDLVERIIKETNPEQVREAFYYEKEEIQLNDSEERRKEEFMNPLHCTKFGEWSG